MTVGRIETFRKRAGKLLVIALRDSNETFKIKQKFLKFRDGLVKIQL
jgi:hypothetical protein